MVTVVQPEDLIHPWLQCRELSYDPTTRTLGRGGRSRHLAPREAALLEALLASESGRVFGRDELLDAVWGNGDVCEDALTVIVSRLRRHFQRLGLADTVIATVPRRGYRLCDGGTTMGRLVEARRDGRLARTLGWAALAVSTLALITSLVALSIVV